MEGRLYRSDDAGRTWEHVTRGYPERTRGNIDTFHLAFTPDGTAWAVAGRRLYRSDDRGRTWDAAWEAPGAIELLATEAA